MRSGENGQYKREREGKREERREGKERGAYF